MFGTHFLTACKVILILLQLWGAQLCSTPKDKKATLPIDLGGRRTGLIFWNQGEGDESHATGAHSLFPEGILCLPGEPGEAASSSAQRLSTFTWWQETHYLLESLVALCPVTLQRLNHM